MDYSYSPHRETGGILHLSSPTHPHSYDAFPTMSKLRRSMSRSPSKSRFQIYGHKSPNISPGSPLSPIAVAKVVSPKVVSPKNAFAVPGTPTLEQHPTTTKKKFSLRRTAGFRSSPRINPTPRSPMRRALGESSNQGNITPSNSRRSSRENLPEQPGAPLRESTSKPPILRLDLHDGPVKFEFATAKPKNENLSVANDLDLPVKSSPLKRDVTMNLGDGSSGSPRAKRRSLHSHSQIFGSDSDFLSQTTFTSDMASNNSASHEPVNPFASPAPKRSTESPLRKTASLRKSTLQQRQAHASLRPRHSGDFSGDVPPPSPLLMPRNRMSLDSSLLEFQDAQPASPFVRSTPSANPFMPLRQFPLAPAVQTHQPHPLSQALTPSSSASSLTDSTRGTAATVARPSAPERPLRPTFSRSLPLGATRPSRSAESSQDSQGSSFATPEAFKHARPNPAPFMSTGLMSKRNRNADFPAGEQIYAMPDTPSKRNSFPPVTASPFPKSVVKPRGQPEFGKPSTPFGTPITKSSIPFGGNSNIFGASFNKPPTVRRSSFVSDAGDEVNNSPSSGRHQDNQSSADELPPTPTKPSGKPKESSLRSSLFGRRTSLGPETFAPPVAVDIPSPNINRTSKLLTTPTDTPSKCGDYFTAKSMSAPSLVAQTPTSRPRTRTWLKQAKQAVLLDLTFPLKKSPFSRKEAKQLRYSTATPVSSQDDSGRLSPHTPQDEFVPPDPSNLSISGCQKKQPMFGSSTKFRQSLPPATPTAPREHVFSFSAHGLPVAKVTQNDVDTSLTSRFGEVIVVGGGEFSKVYRVKHRQPNLLNFSSPAPAATPGKEPSSGWAVKKTKKPYSGHRDREQKLREVNILKALRGNDHVIDYVDHWESKGHLYIQTEFCELGNLKDFLASAGNKGRLDDFRVWKVLLELSLGVKHIHDNGFIHLDLKPANVFIDYGGVLKIGDFGLASQWPAPPHIEGEGDREYIGPEVLAGRFDKPADIFALGMIMAEIAANVILPDNGASWQRLRAGDMTDLPSLTWSSESALARNESGEPIDTEKSFDTQSSFFLAEEELTPLAIHRPGDLVIPPNFMIDPEDEQALDRIVQWMISPDPNQRPVIDEIYSCKGVKWVEQRHRAGAAVYEGNWGPSDDVLGLDGDVDMLDV
jgi:mitosis inhibitor protein kinase SWE1